MIAKDTKSILERVIDASGNQLTPEIARSFLSRQFSADDHRKTNELSEKARNGELSPTELEEFQEYCVIDDLISLLHLRADDVLHNSGTPEAH